MVILGYSTLSGTNLSILRPSKSTTSAPSFYRGLFPRALCLPMLVPDANLLWKLLFPSL